MPADAALTGRAFQVATPGAPRWSPDGRLLAYALAEPDIARNRYESALWIVETASGRHWAVVAGLEGSGVPFAWSPDGDRLAYIAEREERHGLEVHDLASGESRALAVPENAHGPIAVFESFVTLEWSPDGTRLLYSAQDSPPDLPPDPVVNPRNDGDTCGEIQRIRLWTVPVEGEASPTPLTSARFHSGAGQWSPDGSTVVFVSNRSGREEGAHGSLNQPFDLWTVPGAGGEERPLVRGPGANQRPCWSPKGERLAFTGAARYGSHRDVMTLQVVRAGGDARRRLTAGLDRTVDPCSAQAWASPDELLVTVAVGPGSAPYRVTGECRCTPIPAGRPFVTGIAARPGEDAMAWVAQGPTDPPEVQIVDGSGEVGWQSHHNAASGPAARWRHGPVPQRMGWRSRRCLPGRRPHGPPARRS